MFGIEAGVKGNALVGVGGSAAFSIPRLTYKHILGLGSQISSRWYDNKGNLFGSSDFKGWRCFFLDIVGKEGTSKTRQKLWTLIFLMFVAI